MSNYTLILVAIALAVFVFFQFRTSRKRAKETAERQQAIVPGVEVMTNYGLFGTIKSIDDENNFAFLEVSPGNIIKIHKSTILKTADDLVVPESEAELASEGSENAPASYELNTDTAITSELPKFGERAEPVKKPVRKTTKKVED